MRCRGRVPRIGEERKTGVVACSACDPKNLFAMGRPVVFLIVKTMPYDGSDVHSVWTARGVAEAEADRMEAADPCGPYYSVHGMLLLTPEDA